jgi:hypothetical protein
MTEGSPESKSWRTSRSGLVLLAFLVVGGFFLLTEHTAHVFGVLPYLLVLACPLMHFLHGGHHRGKDHDGTPPASDGGVR